MTTTLNRVKKPGVSARGAKTRHEDERPSASVSLAFLSPVCNTGGKFASATQPPVEKCVILHDGKNSFPVVVSKPNNHNEIAAIDWITISAGVESYGDKYLGLNVAERERGLDKVAELVDQDLRHIFGFGIDKKRDKGMHFYEYSWVLEDNFGLFLAGHTTGRISIQINGTGTAYAKDGWQKRLYNYLVTKAERATISRIDLCYDDYNGVHDVDWANEQDSLGRFGSGGRLPSVQHMGNWKRPDGKGRTLMVGKRENGKCARIYEKGKQLGDPTSLWVRHEVEILGNDRIIPFETLLEPTSYFIASYACFADFNTLETPPAKIKTKQVEAKTTWDNAIANLRHSYGKYLNMFRQVHDDSDLLQILTHKRTAVPDRLIPCEILARRTILSITSDDLASSGQRASVTPAEI